MFKISRQIQSLIREALAEDIGPGDVTTHALVPAGLFGEAHIIAKTNGILCGAPVVRDVFRAVDSRLKIR